MELSLMFRMKGLNTGRRRAAQFLLLAFFSLLLSVGGFAQTPPNKRAEKLSKEGYSEFYKGNYKKAIENCDKAIKVQPQLPYAYYIKGWSHFRLGQHQQAVIALNKALEQGHDQFEVAEVRGQALYFLKDLANAEKDLTVFANSAKSNGPATFVLAQILFAQQKYSQAGARFQKALEQGYKDKNIQYYLAVCLGAAQDRAGQERAANQAIQDGTQFLGEAYYQAGNALYNQKKFDAAIAAYDKALQLKPSIKEAYYDLYQIYRQLNRDDKAVDIMKRRTKEDPTDVQGFLNLSWIASLSKRSQDAVEAALQATKLAPRESTGFTNMCRAYNDLKLYDSAIQACNDALAIKPGDGETYLYLARAKDEQKKANEATLYFDKAVIGLIDYTRQNPDNADGFYLLGNAFYSAKQRNKAIPAYLRALELNPRYVQARYNLGYIYAQLGDYRSAKDQYDLLVVLDADLAARLLPNIEKPGKQD